MKKKYVGITGAIFFILLVIGLVFKKKSTSLPEGKNLNVMWESLPRTIDPRYATDADSQYLESLIHCSLFEFDRDGKLQPWLADQWKWENPRQLRLKIKTGYKFSDGKPVTIKDVAETYRSLVGSHQPQPARAGAFANIASIETAGEDQIEFTLKEEEAPFLTNLIVGVLPAEYAGRPMLTERDLVPSCGPFTLQQMNVSDLVLGKNNHYGGTKAMLDRVTIKVVKDETTRLAKLKKQEADLCQNLINRTELESLDKDPAFQVYKRQGLTTTYLGFNMKDPVLSKLLVRQAFDVAINRQEIIKFILKNFAQPAATLLPPLFSEYVHPKVAPTSYDPDLAKKLLDQAGFVEKPGQPRFTVSYKTTVNATRIAIAKEIGAQLAKVGVKVIVEPLEWGRFKSDVDAGRVQLWSLSWVGFKDPDIFRFAFGSAEFPPNGGNRGWFVHPELDQLLKEGRRTVDVGHRREIYHRVQEIVASEVPYVFLWHEDITAVSRKGVDGFELYADGRYSSLGKVTVD